MLLTTAIEPTRDYDDDDDDDVRTHHNVISDYSDRHYMAISRPFQDVDGIMVSFHPCSVALYIVFATLLANCTKYHCVTVL